MRYLINMVISHTYANTQVCYSYICTLSNIANGLSSITNWLHNSPLHSVMNYIHQKLGTAFQYSISILFSIDRVYLPYIVDSGSTHWTSFLGHTIIHVLNCASIDKKSIALDRKIIVCCFVGLQKLTVMLTSMKNIVMNTTSQCSTIIPHSDIINIYANTGISTIVWNQYGQGGIWVSYRQPFSKG